ncbi:hypothetical protein T10_6150 [Trichinella papuae]|uniref:Uncharacterized protein n=1 Tax=Trichinella papuae TaxID=268474 RepID=A0A0V1MAZ7_9BILA|nr:hypothetical protein T10_6150 [Trichinella papuae]
MSVLLFSFNKSSDSTRRVCKTISYFIWINMGKLKGSELCKLAMDANCQIKMIMFSYRISSFYVVLLDIRLIYKQKFSLKNIVQTFCFEACFHRGMFKVAIEAFLWDEEFLLIIGMLDDAPGSVVLFSHFKFSVKSLLCFGKF